MTSLSSAPPVDLILDRRDRFSGQRACLVCGDTMTVHHCFIIPRDDSETWTDLKSHGWIPQAANRSPGHEPRNGMLLCPDHLAGFNNHSFFIRFSPEARKYVFINYSNYDSFAPFHGKAIALDARDPHAPFPTLFIIHELRVRAFHPFQPLAPTIPVEITWQDWIYSRGVFEAESGFIRDTPPLPDNGNGNSQLQYQTRPSTSENGGPTTTGVMNDDVSAEILDATRAQSSWKACESENTDGDDTAEENIETWQKVESDLL